MWSYLYILLSVAALFGLKYYLLNYAYDRRKNIFCEPDFLAAESIKKYKKQKKVGALIKFRDINYVENIWKYSFDGIQEVVAQYKKLNKAADREFANYVGIHSLNMAVYLHMYLALQDPENRDKIRVNLKERMEPTMKVVWIIDKTLQEMLVTKDEQVQIVRDSSKKYFESIDELIKGEKPNKVKLD